MDSISSYQCAWAAVHAFGLAMSCAVRVYAGTAAEHVLQGLFLLSLATVGVAALAGQQFGWSLWTVSAATMTVMIVASVADFGQRCEERVL
jgi:hypothetical protein